MEHQEDITKGPCTQLEYLLIAAIVEHTHNKEIECTVDAVHAIYQACVTLASTLKLKVPLGVKNKKDIETVVQQYERHGKNFEAICVAQLKINCTKLQ